jgi:hypothetical protein
VGEMGLGGRALALAPGCEDPPRALGCEGVLGVRGGPVRFARVRLEVSLEAFAGCLAPTRSLAMLTSDMARVTLERRGGGGRWLVISVEGMRDGSALG